MLLLENLYGDIVSDLARASSAASASCPAATSADDAAVFEAVHGSAPDIAGKGIAIGFAMPLPAMSGAEPWTASKTAALRP